MYHNYTPREQDLILLGINLEVLERAKDHAQAEGLIDLYGWDDARLARQLADAAPGCDLPAPTVRPDPESIDNWRRLGLIWEQQIRNETRLPSDGVGARRADLAAMLAVIPESRV